ncbi:hypothetical protein LZ31DRAFT_102069 [Colletotrichum somersetense]|nr:hypothetical protein LZ31DRAFT_102069 [Colletotrichum somersetense]
MPEGAIRVETRCTLTPRLPFAVRRTARGRLHYGGSRAGRSRPKSLRFWMPAAFGKRGGEKGGTLHLARDPPTPGIPLVRPQEVDDFGCGQGAPLLLLLLPQRLRMSTWLHKDRGRGTGSFSPLSPGDPWGRDQRHLRWCVNQLPVRDRGVSMSQKSQSSLLGEGKGLLEWSCLSHLRVFFTFHTALTCLAFFPPPPLLPPPS